MPPWIATLQHVTLVAFLGGTMMAMGLRIPVAELLRPLQDLRLVAWALVLNFVLSPALAWGITRLIPMHTGHIAGLLVLAGAAGAPFLPRLADVSRDPPAVAGALVLLLSAGTIAFMALAMPSMVPGLASAPWAIARPMLLLILLPLAVGLLMRATVPVMAQRLAPFLARIGNASLLVLFAMLVVLNFPRLIGVLGSGAVAAAILYTGGLFVLSRMVMPRRTHERGLLALGACARNFGAALVPVASSFRDPDVGLMIIVCAIVDLAVSFAFASWMARQSGPPDQ